MRMSTRGRYALRAMVDLGLHQESGPVQRGEIARRQEIPSPYLARLMVQLARAGLIEGERGPGGGYRLSRPADEIRASDIIRATEGPLEPVSCTTPGTAEPCSHKPFCAVAHLWARLGQAICEVLDTVSLEDLCLDARRLQAAQAPND